jgi:hypothetical protein
LRFIHVRRRQDRGFPRELELVDEIPELPACLRVEARGRFIEEQQIRITDQRARQREALLLAAREGTHTSVLLFVKLDEGDDRGHLRALMEKAAEQPHRLTHGELFGQLCVLQLDTEALAQAAGVCAPPEAEDLNLARIRLGEALANLDRGRLSSTVGTEKTETLAQAHLQVEAGHGGDVLVALSKIADLKGGGRRYLNQVFTPLCPEHAPRCCFAKL